MQVSRRERPDAIVLTDLNSAQLIAGRLPAGLAAILPVVDASRRQSHGGRANRQRADLHIAAPSRAGFGDALEMLVPIIERVRSLPATVLSSDDPRLMLLARLVVRDRGIEPRRDPKARETIVYADESSVPGVVRHAEDLVALGLLHKEFFDMLITCPRCDSGRLCVRERCSACRSTNLVEESIFHHLRCAYQAPEHEFRNGRTFTCPKCRSHLEHFSVDYDRPGSLSVCRACGHASGETSVGFLCLDCEAESDSADMGSRTIHRYEVSEAGHECLRSGAALPAPGAQEDSAIYRIRNFVARQTAANEPCCILRVQLEEPPGRSAGRSYLQTCELFASSMREAFTSETEIVESTPRFFALLANDDKAEVESALPEIRTALEQYLSSPPKIHYSVHAPDEIQHLLDSSETGDAAEAGNGRWT
jgi:hypothetical protein